MVASGETAESSGPQLHRVLRVIAVILGVAYVLFLGIFALDAFATGVPLAQQLVGFGIHVIPNLILLVVIAFAWRFPAFGGATLALLSGLPLIVLTSPVWVNLILALPLFVTGCLFLASALLRRQSTRTP